MQDRARKGARRMADIPPEVMHAINLGERPTLSLVEFLAVDLSRLLPTVSAQIGLDPRHPALRETMARLATLKPMQRHRAIAAGLLTAIDGDSAIEARLAGHVSDLARQWAALMVGLRSGSALAIRLRQIRPFAADPHFGVREMAWMAVRDAVAGDVAKALALLQPWTVEADSNLRRFASEVTRPRGVWCAHLEALKQAPEPGHALLHPLRADPSRYVQDSVANWLNDAAKSRPDWVRRVCADWLAASDQPATAYICRRAQRSLPAT